eukprot:snap_masked-scaffold_12-processed-gene-10.41-mRNA-1 protein AED:0.18 eAED:0.35 QI:0/0/0/1/1/1/2/0/433
MLFPLFLNIFLTTFLLLPSDNFFLRSRCEFLSSCGRVFFPSTEKGVQFVEVILGDILTSISKALGDIVLTCFVFYVSIDFTSLFLRQEDSQLEQVKSFVASGAKASQNSLFDSYFQYHGAYLDSASKDDMYSDILKDPFHTDPIPDDDEGLEGEAYIYEKQLEHSFLIQVLFLRAFMISLPFLLRFRQCFFTFKRSNYKNKIQLALPVIILSALLNSPTLAFRNSLRINFSFQYLVPFSTVSKTAAPLFSMKIRKSTIRNLWLAFSSINSLYSFMWDILMDWGMCQESAEYIFLRPVSDLYFGKGRGKRKLYIFFYYFSFVFDFCFRIIWSFKLSLVIQLTSGDLTLLLELCEVIRRFVWILLRVEWEHIKTRETLVNNEVDEPLCSSGILFLSKKKEMSPASKRRPKRNKFSRDYSKIPSSKSLGAVYTLVS